MHGNILGADHIRKKDMKIKRFERDDLNDLLKIESLSFSDPWSQDMFLALHKINPKGFYVVKYHQKIVAYAIVLLEPYIDGALLRKRGHIINLAVAPEFRKQNIASHLIDRIQHDLRKQKANMILLEVRRSNTIALQFYSKLMFKRIGSIDGFYKDEDAIVMSKDI